MGSFNTLCFVSHQTIAPGNACVILPIAQNTTFNPVELLMQTRHGVKQVSKYGYSHSNTSVTSFWEFAGPLVKGVYDDYGRFELSETNENERNLRYFFNSLAEKVWDVKPGENPSHEHGFIFSGIYNEKKAYTFKELIAIWDVVFDLASEHRLFVRNYQGEPVNVGFAVMHKVSADYIIEQFSKGKSWGGESLEQKSYFHAYLNKHIKRFDEMYDNNKFKDKLAFIAVTASSLQDFSIGDDEGMHIGNHYLDAGLEPVDIIAHYFEKNPDQRAIPEDIADKLFDFFKAQIEHRYLASALSSFDIKLSPMVYADQDYSNEIGNKYLTMISDINKQVNQLVKDNNDEYEEDDDESDEEE
jgi:hypothetical protein